MNVKKFQLLSSSLASLPTQGLKVNGSAKLQIRDCVFEKIHFQSIVVERTKELEMVGNQFGGPGVKILSYRDSSSAMIRCNRVVGAVIMPECSLSIHTVSTVASTDTSQVYTRYQYRSMEELREIGEEKEGGWLVIIFGAVLLFSIVIYTSYLSYNNWQILIRLKNDVLAQFSRNAEVIDTVEDSTVLKEKTIPDPPPPPEPVESETLLNSSKNSANGKTQVLSPIWLNEIQSNEIFNKQKKITHKMDDKDISDAEETIKNGFDKNIPEERVENGSKHKKEFKEYVY